MNTPSARSSVHNRRYSTATWVSNVGPPRPRSGLRMPAPLAPGPAPAPAFPEPYTQQQQQQQQDQYAAHDGPVAYGDMAYGNQAPRTDLDDDDEDDVDTDVEESMDIDPNGAAPPSFPAAPGAPGSDFHTDSPAEFARRPNPLLLPPISPAPRAAGRFTRLRRAMGRFFANVFSIKRLVGRVKTRAAMRRQRPTSVPGFEFRDPTPAPPSIRLTYSRDLEDGRHAEVQEQLVSRSGDSAGGRTEGQQPVTMIDLGTIKDENDGHREEAREEERQQRVPGAMPLDRQASQQSHLSHHSATGPISRERSHKSSRTQGDTGETTAVHHDSPLTGAEYDRDRPRHSPRRSGSGADSARATSPPYPAQPPPSLRKSHSLSTRSMRSGDSRSLDTHSTLTHSSNLLVHLKNAYHALEALYHLPWVAAPPHRLTVDFVPALSSARSKYRARRGHGRASGVPAADLAAARANADMAEGESWYRLSHAQMQKRRERREKKRAARRSYSGTHSRRSSDYYQLTDAARPASPRRPPAAYASPTAAAAAPLGVGAHYTVAVPNGLGGQQFYVFSPPPGAAPPLPLHTPHGSPGESTGTARANEGGRTTPSRRLSIMSGRRRMPAQQQSSQTEMLRGSPPAGGAQPMYFMPAYSPAPGASPPPGMPPLPPNYMHAFPYPYSPGTWAPGPLPLQSQPQGQAQVQQH